MRYYDIQITPDGGTAPLFRWSSHPNGVFDPSALTVEFDMPVAAYAIPTGGMSITIYGVDRQTLSQAYQLSGMDIEVRGGMQRGLPLASASQSGVLLRGQVFQAFGNWEGTEMRLDLVIQPSPHSIDNPGNFILFWNAGQTLGEALRGTFSVVYPGMPISMNVGDNLVFDYPEAHYCATLEELSQLVADITRDVFKQEVFITIQAGKIIVFDSTYKPPPIQINFTDLVGQPTWIQTGIMQMKTVMRADLQIGSVIQMPTINFKGKDHSFPNAPGFTTTSPSAALGENGGGIPSTGKDSTIFMNNFHVVAMRHIGNSRSSNGGDWCSVFNCVENK